MENHATPNKETSVTFRVVPWLLEESALRPHGTGV
jgi:hypothetical protein